MEGDIMLRIHRMRGEMHPLKNGVVDFDDPLSYLTDVASAEVGMTGADLTALMGRVFNYKGAPLSNVRVDITPDGLRQRGTLHKGVDIAFDMMASVSLTSDGRIQLHPSSMHILGVNGLVLMKALGLSLEKMMDLSKAHGVTVKGNDLFLDAIALLPPPQIRGRLSSVRLSSTELVQTIGTGTDDELATPSIDRAATNYMLYRGGTLHFGKLFMTDAEMLVVDEDQTTPFDFDNARYHRQLIAGHSEDAAGSRPRGMDA